MRPDLLANVVPNADPDFLRVMSRLPDPPPHAYEFVIAALPKLHALFLEKRDAVAKNDIPAFEKIIEEEVELLRSIHNP